MFMLVILIVAVLAASIVYSYLIHRSFKNKILLFLPSILGSLWFIYLFTLYEPDQSVGLAGIAVLVYIILTFFAIIANLSSSIFLIYRNKNRESK